jgi:hypothetical protein
MLGDRWFVTWPSLERGDDLDMISFVVEAFSLSGVINSARLHYAARGTELDLLSSSFSVSLRPNGRTERIRFFDGYKTRRAGILFLCHCFRIRP